MSYKSLLYCPDEKAARVVTQVLSELEFTVELSNEPFAAVKTLTDQHFDALVVDLVDALDKFKVGEKEKGDLLGALGPMKSDIVEK